MKSKTLLASLFSLMVIVSIAGGICVAKADATGEPKVSYDTWGEISRWNSYGNLILTIVSPLPNEVLRDNTAIVRVNISSPAWAINSVYYEADWQEGMHCIYNVNNQTLNIKVLSRLFITANFTDIPNGRHHLTIYVNIHDGSHGSSSVDFTIMATPPAIVILSPVNTTYQTANLPLSFTVNKPMKWAGYSLDGQEAVTVTGNVTLAELPEGLHNVAVYANDTSGNKGASETIGFTIAVPQPFPTVHVAAAFVSIGLATLGVLVCFNKRKRQPS